MGQITFKTGTITFKGGTVTFKNVEQVATPTVTNVYWNAGKIYYTVTNTDFASATIYTAIVEGDWTSRGIKLPGNATDYNQMYPDPGIPGYEVFVYAYASVPERQDSVVGVGSYTF